MFSKEEAYQIKKDFWTKYGQYMALNLNSDGEKINWINYKTGIKALYFKTNVDNKKAIIEIEMSMADVGIQELVFEQFESYEMVLESYIGEKWQWLKNDNRDGKIVSTIGIELQNISIFRASDWPEIIQFFKPRMMALDCFWNDHKDSFDIFKTY